MSNDFDIAVIGMAGRFPGADDVDALWQVLCEGRITLARFDPRVGAAHAPADAAGELVPVAGALADIDRFDNEFFNIHPREAEAMDPQHRLFLECAWHALEDSGYAGEDKPVTGLFAACGPPAYLLSQFCRDGRMINHFLYRTGNVAAVLNGNEPDLLPLRAAYKLDLHGPVVNVQTACSSSLVAVAQACQSLVTYESDMCLAGGVHVRSPDANGYFHQREGILSRDGRCRPFDRDATGTVFGDGLGIVVLRRLEDALADGDRIEAVIKGWAVNNDGSRKASMSAPSADGQAAAITAAHALAEVAPETIQYVEAHGTGTVVGDGIELAGLRRAWGGGAAARCGIGSIKSNIGHLDAAAGVAGLIKTILCLKHARLVPSLGCDTPLPRFEDADNPFYVLREAADWPDDVPRRAGVSSLGVGGTNCHVVLEGITREDEGEEPGKSHLLTLSARTPESLRTLARRFVDHLALQGADGFRDACYTSNTGRRHFQHRLAVTADNAGACRQALAAWLANPAGQPASRSAVRDFPALLDAYDGGGITDGDLLEAAARHYEAGGDIEWSRLHGERHGRRAALPLYPFEDRRHWHRVEEIGVMQPTAGMADTPAHGTRLTLPFGRETRFQHRWHAAYPAYLPHHRLFDTVVFPASAHLALMITTWRALHRDAPGGLERIRFLRPLVIPTGREMDAQLILDGEGEPGDAVRLAAAPDGQWAEFVQARTAAPAQGARVDVEAITQRCPRGVSGDEFYRNHWAQGDDTGASFRWLEKIAIGDGEALGWITRPAACLGTQSPHPGLLEAVFQLLYCCRVIETRDSVAHTHSVFVPALIDRASWQDAWHGELIGHARIRPPEAGATSIVGDLALIEPNGRTVMRIEGFELRPLRAEALAHAPLPAAYAVYWPVIPLPPAGSRQAVQFVLLGEPNRFGEAVAHELEASGRTRLVSKRIDPESTDCLDAFVGGDPEPTELVYMWPLSIRFDPCSGDPGPGIDAVIGGLFALVRTVARLPATTTRITVVTRNAQDVGEDAGTDTPGCDPLQAALWGFARVAARELRQLDLRLVDIGDEFDAGVRAVVKECRGPDAERQIVYRNGARHAARLRPAVGWGDAAAVTPGNGYLVTADAGGQGELVAAHLVRQGIPAAAGDPARDFGGLQASLQPAVKGAGVIHTTGEIEDGVIDNMHWPGFRAALADSVTKLLRLHAASRAHGSADFVVFAGAAALLGHPGQAAYAAYGAFADGLARYRRSLGLPARSAFWGAWSSVGKWPHLSKRQQAKLIKAGIAPLDNAAALAALDALIRDGRSGLCLPAIDWSQFPADAGLGNFLRELMDTPPPGAPREVTRNPEPAGGTMQQLAAIIVDQLGVDQARISPGLSMRELGIDSLDAVNLIDAIESEFGVDLAIGEVVDARELDELATRIETQRHEADAPSTDAGTGPTAAVDHAVIVPVKPDGNRRPVFCVPADSSTALSLKPLCDTLDIDRPAHVFQAPGIDNDDVPLSTVEALAARYLAEMLKLQPLGPYTLIGRCTGGLVAFEIALSLQRQGMDVECLVLLDTLPPAAVPEMINSDEALLRRGERIRNEVAARIDGMPGNSRRRFRAVQEALDEAVAAYVPAEAFEGRLIYVRSEADRHPVQDAWRGLVRGGIDYLDAPGDHQSMFQAHNLPALCDALGAALRCA